jgi:hypothetical protein
MFGCHNNLKNETIPTKMAGLGTRIDLTYFLKFPTKMTVPIPWRYLVYEKNTFRPGHKRVLKICETARCSIGTTLVYELGTRRR